MMRESITVHCPKCGKALDAYADVDKFEFGDEGQYDENSVTVHWKPNRIEHRCDNQDDKR
jgi:hypothetical protein